MVLQKQQIKNDRLVSLVSKQKRPTPCRAVAWQRQSVIDHLSVAKLGHAKAAWLESFLHCDPPNPCTD